MKLSEFRRRIDALDDAKALGSDPEVTVKVYGGGEMCIRDSMRS